MVFRHLDIMNRIDVGDTAVMGFAAESVERLRTWATGRCLDADEGAIYRHNGAAKARPGRKVRRPGPSSN